MKWQPDPMPVMADWERDGLRDYIIEHGGWGELPPILVDEDGNLIDGYKRAEVYTVVAHRFGWPLNCPATVIQGGARYPDDAERAAAYVRLRAICNSKTTLTDEIEAWLDPIR